MQAIAVKFLDPTNNRGSRYKAECEAGTITVGTDYALNPSDNAKAAVKALLVKLGWHEYVGDWHLGQLKNGYYVAVHANSFDRIG